MNIYQEGNTIRITGQFNDWDGAAIDPTIVRLKVYNAKYELVDSLEVPLTNKIAVGEYFYDYTFSSMGDFIYEWYAEIDGTPSIKRQRIRIVKV